MRFVSVHARAFGPFTDRSLDLGPGLNVIHGPNECGKSSWYAALVLGLCGIARRRGRVTKDYEAVRASRRPWSALEWRVGVVVEQDDGRLVELHHDLDERTGVAHDTVLGRDLTGELVDDGAPDGARLVGLDRRAFQSVACVGQADILAITAQADALQLHLQRAAATAGTDATAATAIEAIDEFRRTEVGKARAKATKPLQLAIEAHGRAAADLETARAAHHEYLRRASAVTEAEAEAARRRVARLRAEVTTAEAEADQRADTLARVETLAALHPDEPVAPRGNDELAQRASTALGGWAARPAVPAVPDPGPRALTARLAALAESAPDGQSAPSLAAARVALDHSEHDRRAHRAAEPATPPVGPAGVSELDDPERTEAIATVTALVLAFVLAAGGLAALTVAPALGGGLLLAAAVVAAGSVAAARHRVARRQRAATRRAAAASQARAAHDAHEHWAARDRALAAVHHERVEALVRAGEREQLLAQLGATEVAVIAAAQAREQRAALHHELTACVAALRDAGDLDPSELEGDLDGDPGDAGRLAAVLGAWLVERRVGLDDAARARDEWLTLQSLLGDHTLTGLRQITAAAATRAVAARRVAEAGAVDLAERFGIDPIDIAPATGDVERAEREATGARSALEEFARRAPNVAEAEEALTRAEEELTRVRRLDDVLATTMALLEVAQERVHRDLAPELARRTAEHLADVTAGRYDEVRVDPATLLVRVRDERGELRRADQLSHGTAEQIYLLLRVAMADVLARDEACPLLLDDPTVHADPARTRALLAVLHRISRDRQVVLFTQEPDVVTWAGDHLDPGRDRLIALDPPGAAPRLSIAG